MSGSWRRLAFSSVLLVVVLGAVSAGLGILGGLVMLPQLGAVGWVAIGLALFMAVQLLLFRLFGLRSQADEKADGEAERDADEQAPPPDDEQGDGDWRAWRG